MAELAIPAVALGALYICSNKDKKEKETYQNLNTNSLVLLLRILYGSRSSFCLLK